MLEESRTFTMLVDRKCQNEKGALIVHLKPFMDKLLRRVGYVGMKKIMRREYCIFVVVK